MGNNKSKGQNFMKSDIQPKRLGDVFIKTDQSCYFACEFISGNIYLNVIEDGFPACTVYLSVTGKEKCEWTETTTTTEPDQNGNQRQTTSTQTFTGKSYILQHKLNQHTFEGPLQPIGQFVFPFQFQLLSHLASSFYEKDLAEISYKVKALVQSKQSSFNLSSTVKSQQLGSHQDNLEPLWLGKCIQLLRSTVSKEMELATSNVLLINLTFYQEMNLDQPVHSFSIRLSNSVTLTDNDGNNKYFYRYKASQSIQGVAARSKKQMNVKFVLRDNYYPYDIQPSVKGKLIEQENKLLISGDVECISKFQFQLIVAAKNLHQLITQFRFWHLHFKTIIQNQRNILIGTLKYFRCKSLHNKSKLVRNGLNICKKQTNKKIPCYKENQIQQMQQLMQE